MISLADRCPRSAAYKYFSEHPREPRPDADDGRSLGQLLHDAQERYSKFGEVPPADTEVGAMFRASLPHIATPHVGASEERREFGLGGHRYLVLLDWMGQSNELPGAPEGMPANLDFKTSSNPKKFGIGIAPDKPPHEDIQAILYATYRLAEDKEAPGVFSRWIYLKTKVKRKVPIVVDFQITRGQCQDAYNERIYPTSMLLSKLAEHRPDPNEVEPNAAACDDYRGCYYSEERGGPCRLTTAQRRERFTSDMGNILDSFKKPAPTAAPAAAPAAVIETSAEPVVESAAINPPDEIQGVPEPEAPPEPEKKPRKARAKKATEPDPLAVQGVIAISSKLGTTRFTEDEAAGVLALLKELKS